LRHRTLKIGLAAATAVAMVLPIALIAQPAYADYAPGPGDVVGLGADTLQFMLDFMADGNAYGDVGYNHLGNKYKLVNFDATGDANARLAYGVDGGQQSQATCTPGTGSTVGTGNSTSTNTGVPCVLNPTVVLRAGLQPVQRPNGGGAGFKALVQDVIAGHNTAATEVINYASDSSSASTTATMPGTEQIDQLSVATDTLPMITSTGTGETSNAYPLDAAQLLLIYEANTGSCITWSDPRISGYWLENAVVTTGSDTVNFPSGDPQPPTSGAPVSWAVQGTGIPSGTTVSAVGTGSITLSAAATASNTENVGLVNTAASTAAIVPLIPQVGSGTRKYFMQQINGGSTFTAGTCTYVSEENDPTAIYDVSTGAGLDPRNAIEPISQGRLDLYQGITSTGKNEGFGYFTDPSCPYLQGSSTCGSGSVGGGSDTYEPLSVTPAVADLTGTPVGLGAYSGNGPLFDPTRTLYLEVRNSDITSTTAWQPGTSENWLNTLFYDPCEAGQTCTTSPTYPGVEFGPDGPPYIETASGIADLEDAGVTPIAVTCVEITNGNTAC